ncbi:molybdopterin synthase sulfur carrier subunit [Candidatus Sodalis sp. SoCistrobi]|uniref:molybdopterin synthase sulfur carrier subunit n=1 Tax=Candidatus Sodalis sp. SoCistrobi TaxID=1922216 RepID=UPI00093A97BE|nr:molybdopterin synthase sulfur carrier subunit [Candidatus Sodalis sp. SoCistrobi]
MITVLFFAQVRELTGVERLSVDAGFASVEALRQALALEPGKLLAAVNQSLVTADHPLAAGDEVAFFPPVTGG